MQVYMYIGIVAQFSQSVFENIYICYMLYRYNHKQCKQILMEKAPNLQKKQLVYRKELSQAENNIFQIEEKYCLPSIRQHNLKQKHCYYKENI